MPPHRNLLAIITIERLIDNNVIIPDMAEQSLKNPQFAFDIIFSLFVIMICLYYLRKNNIIMSSCYSTLLKLIILTVYRTQARTIISGTS